MNTIPRRNQIDKFVPAELAIYKAMEEVEKMDADVRLTNAINKLSKAKDFVSNFVDQIPMPGLIERLIDEKNELDAKAAKLEVFMMKDEFKVIDIAQQSLLRIQFKAMLTYSQCLQERLMLLQSYHQK